MYKEADSVIINLQQQQKSLTIKVIKKNIYLTFFSATVMDRHMALALFTEGSKSFENYNISKGLG